MSAIADHVAPMRVVDTTMPLPHEDGSVDHLVGESLARFSYHQTADVLKEWARVVKPGGTLTVRVPDFDEVSRRYQQRIPGEYDATLLGPQQNCEDSFRSFHDEAGLWHQLHSAGLCAIERVASEPLSLVMRAVKPSESVRSAFKTRKSAVCLTMPRLMPSDNFFCAYETFGFLNMPLIKNTGVFWAHGMERIFEDAIMSGVEWLVTVDYDTVFTPDDFKMLASLFEAHPEIHALAALQVKREGDHLLFWNGEQPTTYRDTYRDCLEVETAHFGLTILDASRVADLPKPWFCARPSGDGDWRDKEDQGRFLAWRAQQRGETYERVGGKRVDDDIAFWHKWREAGNTVAIAPRVCVGHAQWMVTWPDEYFRPHHQYMGEWQARGKPKEARR